MIVSDNIYDAYESPSASNLILLTFFVTLRPSNTTLPRVRVTELQKVAKIVCLGIVNF